MAPQLPVATTHKLLAFGTVITVAATDKLSAFLKLRQEATRRGGSNSEVAHVCVVEIIVRSLLQQADYTTTYWHVDYAAASCYVDYTATYWHVDYAAASCHVDYNAA